MSEFNNFEIDYLNGWFGEESDASGSFRWIGQTAICKIKNLEPPGKRYLCFQAGHSFLDKEIPDLEIIINGNKAGSRKITSAFSVYSIPFDESGELIIEFMLDRVFKIPGDGRDLGIMIRDLAVLLPEEMNFYADGWYLPEMSDHDENGQSRWMKQKALCIIGPVPSGATSFFVLTCGHPFEAAEAPKLEIKISGGKKEVYEILPGQNRLLIPLKNVSGMVEAELCLDKVFDKSKIHETRELGMIVTKWELLDGDSVDTYFEGWYPPENKDQDSFQGSCRWMRQKAVLVFTNLEEKARRFLVIKAGHPFRDEVDPELRILVSGEEKAVFKINPDEKKYLVPLGMTQDYIRVDLILDKTFPAAVPGDKRTLGILVKEVELKVPSEIEKLFEGWYDEERSGHESSGNKPRWMKQEAVCFFSGLEPGLRRYLLIRGGHTFHHEEDPVLKVWVNQKLQGETKIHGENNVYIFPLENTEDHVQVDMKLNKIFKPLDREDKRELGILVDKVEILSKKDNEILIAENYNGWNEWEQDNFYEFVWISENAKSGILPRQVDAYKYISFYAFSEFMDFSQKLRLKLQGVEIGEIPLMHKWNFYSVEIKPGPGQNENNIPMKSAVDGIEFELEFSVNKLFPLKFHLDDKRNLGVRVAELRLHDDDDAHSNYLYFHRNAIMNYREMIEGKTELESYPLNLGIDLYGKCNIKPPCVYCLWDSMKELEGEYSDVNVDEKTLEGYGPFFRSARTLVNCSFGEPLLHPRFKEILELFARHHKYLELSTNGQAFTTRTIQALVGKPIFLYVSLDAATKETYAKIRNDKWDSIIPNLELLNRERKKHNNFPKINMVFMPMKVNRGDLEEYFRLCQRIEADALVLRPLLFLLDPKIEKDRGGYHFNYKEELLPRKELEEIFKQCELFSERYGVPVANQFEFGTIKEPGKKTGTDFYFEFQRS